MRKRYIISMCVVVLTLFAVQAFADYDQAAVKEAMQKIAGFYGEASKAAEAKEYFIAAEKLMEIAKAVKSLETITPKKASKEEWDRIHEAMIKAAFRGIGACGEEDDEKLKAALEELGKFRGEGHKLFR